MVFVVGVNGIKCKWFAGEKKFKKKEFTLFCVEVVNIKSNNFRQLEKS